MDDLVGRFANPGVFATMLAAGLIYGHMLWAFNIRPNLVLYAVAVIPGATFLITVWTIRAVQGTPSAIWFLLLLDWAIFAHTGFFSVLVTRWARRRRP